jgi:hypothetical protein
MPFWNYFDAIPGDTPAAKDCLVASPPAGAVAGWKLGLQWDQRTILPFLRIRYTFEAVLHHWLIPGDRRRTELRLGYLALEGAHRVDRSFVFDILGSSSVLSPDLYSIRRGTD